ncbi:MAG TPA: transposase [Thermoplasmata archaeon]|nr:transposase [Thermoplasmata archaeon]
MERGYAIRTVALPHCAEPALFRALLDTRAAINCLLPDWRSHTDESRFDATKRSYPALRALYPHLASGWSITAANETIAVLNAWDRSLRRARREDPERFERMRNALPHRRQLKASLHHNLFVLRDGHLRITIHRDRHLDIDLTEVRNPLFTKYGVASGWVFGLSLTPHQLLFHFRVPHMIRDVPETVGIDLNFRTAVYAASDGTAGAVDLAPILRIQERMDRKRQSIARTISKDHRHQRVVLRRYGRRERRRTDAQLHLATGALVRAVGDRAVAVEELTGLTSGVLNRERRSPAARRCLSRWTHDRFLTMLGYKLTTRMVRVNPEGTSQECPRCGGHPALPREEGTEGSGGGRGSRRMSRRIVCEGCGGSWHRDVAAAIAVLSRGRSVLRGATVPPSARNALLEAAGWRPGEETLRGLIAEPMKGDDAKPETPPAPGRVSG